MSLANGWIIVKNPNPEYLNEGDCTLYIEHSEHRKRKDGTWNSPKRPNDGSVRETLDSGWFEEGTLFGEFAGQPWYKYRERIGKVELLDEWKPLNGKYLFDGLNNCKSFDLLKLNTADCTSFEGMFRGCSSVQTLFDLDRLETAKVENISYMFMNCLQLRAVSIAGWDTSHITVADNVVSGCTPYLMGRDEQSDFLTSICHAAESGIWQRANS